MDHSQSFDFQITNEEGLAYHFSTHGCAMDLKAMLLLIPSENEVK